MLRSLFAALLLVTTTLAANAAATDARDATTETLTLGGGCFWCIEAVFDELKGVSSVESGYAGGRVANPSYTQVSEGRTGHAEVVQITFDPRVVSRDVILQVFFTIHDPTTLNRQGNDVGEQYRSVAFYRNAEQKRVAESYIKQLTDAKTFSRPIVTQVAKLPAFYRAEEYHQNYLERNPNQPYIVINDKPKLAALKKQFGDVYRE